MRGRAGVSSASGQGRGDNELLAHGLGHAAGEQPVIMQNGTRWRSGQRQAALRPRTAECAETAADSMPNSAAGVCPAGMRKCANRPGRRGGRRYGAGGDPEILGQEIEGNEAARRVPGDRLTPGQVRLYPVHSLLTVRDRTNRRNRIMTAQGKPSCSRNMTVIRLRERQAQTSSQSGSAGVRRAGALFITVMSARRYAGEKTITVAA